MGARFDRAGDLGQMQGHRFCIAGGQDQSRTLAFLRTDGTENVGRGGALIMRGAGARAASGPAARDLIFLSDAGLIGEPNFYLSWGDGFFPRDFRQAGGEAFLKSSITPAA
jgi:hypothetical protein